MPGRGHVTPGREVVGSVDAAAAAVAAVASDEGGTQIQGVGKGGWGGQKRGGQKVRGGGKREGGGV